jgi:hypothetical protein
MQVRSNFSSLIPAAFLCIGVLYTSQTSAELIQQGATVYDADWKISWLENANLAVTNTFGVDGINSSGAMSWDTANRWIEAMNLADYLGHNDWRLPTIIQPDPSCSNQTQLGSSGFCTGSEMGHLFYEELGGTAGASITATHNIYFSLFQNIRPFNYWSGTEYAIDAYGAWVFGFDAGDQNPSDKLNNMYVWPVRLEQTIAVSEPATIALLSLGLAGFGISRIRKKVRARVLSDSCLRA